MVCDEDDINISQFKIDWEQLLRLTVGCEVLDAMFSPLTVKKFMMMY